MIKIILLLVIAICFCVLGKQVSSYFLVRKHFFHDLLSLCSTLKSNIVFLKSNIKDICLKVSFHKELNEVINNYFKFGKIEPSFLNNDEIKLVTEFFDSLGKSDVVGEVNNINYYETEFTKHYEKTSVAYSKTGVTSFKLISLFGLVVVIMFI